MSLILALSNRFGSLRNSAMQLLNPDRFGIDRPDLERPIDGAVSSESMALVLGALIECQRLAGEAFDSLPWQAEHLSRLCADARRFINRDEPSPNAPLIRATLTRIELLSGPISDVLNAGSARQLPTGLPTDPYLPN